MQVGSKCLSQENVTGPVLRPLGATLDRSVSFGDDEESPDKAYKAYDDPSVSHTFQLGSLSSRPVRSVRMQVIECIVAPLLLCRAYIHRT